MKTASPELPIASVFAKKDGRWRSGRVPAPGRQEPVQIGFDRLIAAIRPVTAHGKPRRAGIDP
jgi:hypothetical protein